MGNLSRLLATADPNLQSALTSIQTFFTSNIGIVISAVVGVVLVFWLLRIAFRSFGIGKPKSVS